MLRQAVAPAHSVRHFVRRDAVVVLIVIDEILKKFGCSDLVENCRKPPGAACSGMAAALKRVVHERCVLCNLDDSVGAGDFGGRRALEEARMC